MDTTTTFLAAKTLGKHVQFMFHCCLRQNLSLNHISSSKSEQFRLASSGLAALLGPNLNKFDRGQPSKYRGQKASPKGLSPLKGDKPVKRDCVGAPVPFAGPKMTNSPSARRRGGVGIR